MKLTAFLAMAHLLAIAGAVIAAAANIESIVMTAIPCSLLGIVVGTCGLVYRNFWLVLFGFSTPVLSVCVFLWIFLLSWSPTHAQTPVAAALLGYEMLAGTVGVMGLYQLVSGEGATDGRPWQFNVRSLLLLMLLVGVNLAIVRAALQFKVPMLVVMAIGLGAASLLAASVAVLLAWRQKTGTGSRWQFNIQSLLLLMLVAGVTLAVVRGAIQWQLPVWIVALIGLGTAWLLGALVTIAFVWRQTLVPRPEQPPLLSKGHSDGTSH